MFRFDGCLRPHAVAILRARTNTSEFRLRRGFRDIASARAAQCPRNLVPPRCLHAPGAPCFRSRRRTSQSMHELHTSRPFPGARVDRALPQVRTPTRSVRRNPGDGPLHRSDGILPVPTSVPRVLIAPDPRDPLPSRVPRRPGSTAKSHLNQLSELRSGSSSL